MNCAIRARTAAAAGQTPRRQGRRRRVWSDTRGFQLTELLVVLAVFGILTALALPTVITYWRTATLTAGARELRTVLNQGRALAVARNTTVCVNDANNRIQFLVGECVGGVVWTGQGTDANGWFTLQNRVQVLNNPQVVFNFLGAAPNAGVFTVQNPVDNATTTVTVALSGRITTP